MAAGVMGDPERLASRAGTAWAVPVTAAVPLLVVTAAHGRLDTAATAATVKVVLSTITIAVALALYVRWRITRVPAVAWVTVAVTAVALEHLTLGVTTLVTPERVASRPGWTLLVDTMVMAVLVAVVLARRHVRPPLDPAVLGVAAGLVVGVVRLPTLLADPLLPGSTQLHVYAATFTVLLHLGLALALLCLGLPATLPQAVARVALLLGACGLVLVPVTVWYPWVPLSPWAGAVAALLVAGTAISLLQPTVVVSTRTVAGLRHRVDEIEAGVAADRERLHEINATVAGIATASRLMHDHDDLPADHRVRLDELLAAEIERLERLVEGRESPWCDVDVDETVDRLVLAQRAMGRDVCWSRSGLVVRAQADELAEILTTLLTNAAEHAPGSPVAVSARAREDSVEITVSDRGPGVGDEMAERIFERGARGRTSHGQGIGLFVARRISEHLGGSLFVIPAQAGSSRGAVFVLTLPTTRSHRGAITTAS